jgi:cation transport protein ChaC
VHRKIGFFGYGSLVNADTRPTDAVAIPISINGWIRQWRHCLSTEFGKVCALTVSPASTKILGALVLSDTNAIMSIDQREIGYRRERLELSKIAWQHESAIEEAYIYVSTQPYYRWGDEEYPILRSYLDCVLSGYLRTFGEAGVTAFIESTEGWECPIRDDRLAPLYPRSVLLTNEERETIAAILAEYSIV